MPRNTIRGPFAVVFGIALAAQQPSPPDDLEARVDAICAAARAPGAPGCAVLVALADRVLLAKGYGLADLERNVPITAGSVFDIGSTSKQFTATCIQLLVQDGKLALADKVVRHLAGLPACAAPVTVRHLLLHTSGLPDYVGLLARGNVDYEDRTTPAEALAALQQVEALDFEPGTKWAYSNTNYFLLAGIVECVAGQPLPEFAQQRIFGPLGMENTRVHADCRRLVPNRALSYSKAAGGEWRWNFSNWEQLGDGAVLTTVGDLERWARNFATGTVGGKAWQQAMAGPGTLDDGQPIDYGMGLGFKTQAGRRFVAHGGAWAGYRAELLRVPDEQLTVVCLSNRADLAPTRICADIAKIMAAR